MGSLSSQGDQESVRWRRCMSCNSRATEKDMNTHRRRGRIFGRTFTGRIGRALISY